MFKAEEIVLCTLSDTRVKIKCGPFTSASASEESYLVEWTVGPDRGMCSIVWAQDLKRIPRYTKGDLVTTSAGHDAVVEAGPYPNDYGNDSYVLRYAMGKYGFLKEDLFKRV